MKKNVAVFAFDICEISQLRRIESFIRLGMNVTSYSMRRQNMNANFVPNWPNIHLFTTENEKPFRRIFIIILSWIKICFHLKPLANSDVIIARNFDMLLIALGAKAMLRVFGYRKKIDVVYECLDIHSYFCMDGFRGKIFRLLERIALKFVGRIIVSSPAFRETYFRNIQHYNGEVHVIENKLVTKPKNRANQTCSLHSPIKIGLVGTIRCDPSVRMLLELAKNYPQNIEIHIHGIVHTHSLPNIEREAKDFQNVILHGAYDYYFDLKRIYENLNFVWAQDLWQTNGNSMWLLPNRIYEAGYFGCPSIALSCTETGRKISKMGWGFCVEHSDVATVATKVFSIEKSEYEKICQSILNTPTSKFVQNDTDLLSFFNEAKTKK